MAVAQSQQAGHGSIAADLRPFLRDFASFAGRKGVTAAILLLLGALLEGLSLVLLVPLLAIVIGSEVPSGKLARTATTVFDVFGVEQPIEQMTLLFAIFGALMIVRAVVLYARDMAVTRLRTTFVEAHRLQIIERLAAASWDQIVRLRHARVTQLVSADLQRVGMVTTLVLQIATASTMLLLQAGLIVLLAPLMALVVSAVVAVGFVAFAPLARRAHALGGATTQSNLSLLNLVGQFLGGLKLAVSQNLQSGFVAEFRENLREQARQQVVFARQQTTSRLALTTVAAIASGSLVLIGFGALHIAPATLIILLLITARMTAPAGQIQQAIQQLAHALPIYTRVKALEADLAAIRRPLDVAGDTPALVEGPIVFTSVGFRHSVEEGDSDALRGICGLNLTIQPGEYIGIAGPSGAGKTTFADLLVGLYPPDEGTILVAGVPLRGAALTAWRNRISYISQDAFLFHDSVRQNLAWAAPRASEAEMWRVLDLVGAGALVRGMERGLDTVLGERGTLISGGERQRIALARALLRKPSLLVLDEATSAIDIAGEQSILKALRDLDPHPTIVIVAHRTESLAFCDRVLRFEDGRCVEDKNTLRL